MVVTDTDSRVSSRVGSRVDAPAGGCGVRRGCGGVRDRVRVTGLPVPAIDDDSRPGRRSVRLTVKEYDGRREVKERGEEKGETRRDEGETREMEGDGGRR